MVEIGDGLWFSIFCGFCGNFSCGPPYANGGKWAFMPATYLPKPAISMQFNLKFFLLTVLTMIVGWATRHILGTYLPAWINLWIGDFIWAMMLYFACCTLFLPKSAKWCVVATLIFCYLIEISQLYKADWLDQIRNTKLGGLALGHGFLWSDIIAYTGGILMGSYFTRNQISAA